jgi:hypothetical protein
MHTILYSSQLLTIPLDYLWDIAALISYSNRVLCTPLCIPTYNKSCVHLHTRIRLRRCVRFGIQWSMNRKSVMWYRLLSQYICILYTSTMLDKQFAVCCITKRATARTSTHRTIRASRRYARGTSDSYVHDPATKRCILRRKGAHIVSAWSARWIRRGRLDNDLQLAQSIYVQYI